MFFPKMKQERNETFRKRHDGAQIEKRQIKLPAQRREEMRKQMPTKPEEEKPKIAESRPSQTNRTRSVIRNILVVRWGARIPEESPKSLYTRPGGNKPISLAIRTSQRAVCLLEQTRLYGPRWLSASPTVWVSRLPATRHRSPSALPPPR